MPTNDTSTTVSLLSNSTVQADPTKEINDDINFDDDEIDAYDMLEGDESGGFYTIADDDMTENDAVNFMGRGIMGMPYQFSNLVDVPINGVEDTTSYGHEYTKKIVANMPILFLTPGVPEFLPGYNKEKKAGMLEKLMNDSDGDDISVGEIAGNASSMRYYTFRPKWDDYCDYVNTAVRALSIFMGIQDKFIPEGAGGEMHLGNFMLQRFMNPDFARFANAQSCVPFYLDAETSVSESFSNDTTDSILSSATEGLSSKAREIQSLMGNQQATALADSITKAGEQVTGIGDQLTQTLGFGQGIVNALTSELSTVLTGGKIIFPELWSSSSYSRSYSISIKLRSPDPDPVSIMMNCYIPALCLTALAMPRQVNGSANAYQSPFIVRATYKSIFNCDLGIISSVNITKGGEHKWNTAGLPTAIDVSLDIKDLYSDMFQSRSGEGVGKGWGKFVGNIASSGLISNTAQLDYLALMAGIDMNKADFTRTIRLRSMLTSANAATFIPNVWSRFRSNVNITANKFLSKALGADIRFII